MGAIVGLLISMIPAIPVIPIPVIPIPVILGVLVGTVIGASFEKLKSTFQETYDNFLDWRAERAQIKPELEERKELQGVGREAIKKARRARKAAGELVAQQEKSLMVINRIVKKVEAEKEQEAQEEIDQRLALSAATVNMRQATADSALLRDVVQKAEALRKVRFDRQKRQRALQELQAAITSLQQAPQAQP